MITLILFVILICVVAVVAVKLIDKFLPSNMRIFVQIALGLLTLLFGYFIYSSIMAPIRFDEMKQERFQVAVNKLLDIKKTQLSYKSVHKKYAPNFDELVRFVDNDKFEIIEVRDTSVWDVEKNRQFGLPNAPGGYKKDLKIEIPRGFKSVKDSLFKDTDRYKTMNVVKINDAIEVPITMQTSAVTRKDRVFPTFYAFLDKNALLTDMDQELVKKENKKKDIAEINGDKITLGNLDDVSVVGNWPKKYGNNE